jgi:HAMP domain-containing protein
MKNWFLNLSIKSKFRMGFGSMLLMLAVVCAVSLATMDSLRKKQEQIQQIELNNVIDYLKLENNINSNRVTLLRMMMTQDGKALEHFNREIVETTTENNAIIERLKSHISVDDIPPAKLSELDSVRARFNHLRDKVIIPTLYSTDKTGLTDAIDHGTELHAQVKKICAELSSLSTDAAKTKVAQSVEQVRSMIFILTSISIFVICLTILMISIVQQTIVTPLNRLTQDSMIMAKGNFNLSLPDIIRTDEIGTLSKAFLEMNNSFKNLAALAEKMAEGNLNISVEPRSDQDALAYSVNLMAENMNGLIGEILDAIASLQHITMEIITSSQGVFINQAETTSSKRLQIALSSLEALNERLSTIIRPIHVKPRRHA